MKIHALTMSFNRIENIRLALASFYETCGERPASHIILDQHYPLPSKKENTQKLKDLCRENGYLYKSAGFNVGYHNGISLVCENEAMGDEDVLINYDPDALMLSKNWVTAIRKAFQSDPSLAVVGIVNDVIHREMNERGFHDKRFGDLTVRYPHKPVIMSVVAWNLGFVRKHGLHEENEYYGGIEAAMKPILDRENRTWGVLVDYWEDLSLNGKTDPEYTEWKHKHGRYGTFPGSFDEYLISLGRSIE